SLKYIGVMNKTVITIIKRNLAFEFILTLVLSSIAVLFMTPMYFSEGLENWEKSTFIPSKPGIQFVDFPSIEGDYVGEISIKEGYIHEIAALKPGNYKLEIYRNNEVFLFNLTNLFFSNDYQHFQIDYIDTENRKIFFKDLGVGTYFYKGEVMFIESDSTNTESIYQFNFSK
ncbi:MAG: hypothetical protein AAFP89_19430, partial [Bacteroidota bacterium]